MSPTPSFTMPLFLLCALIVLLPTSTYAFGAGDIPDFAYLNDKAFRHGDIENILENLVKHVGGPAIGGASLLGFASSVLKAATGGSKFNKSDVKRVYFGNWLRDYSQAMDIAGLSKLSADTIVLILSVLGFMTFGFATEEFEVTQDRLGVYLPVEHIDNPRGYAEKEGDARQYHPKLRPPVDPRELEIDERTGMKNYMATENEGWDTSTSFIRRTLKACIEHGRRASGREGPDLWEAYRLLGTGLHTLEDLLAHSNWCEIALRKVGHEEVFCHTGDNVIINTPNGPAPPLVTGTFGGADFLHSLLGEAGDKLSQASVTDLSSKMNQASQGGDSNAATFKAILSKLPIGGNDDKMSQSEEMHQNSKAYRFDPDNIAPPEVQRQLMDLLKWRDDIMREIIRNIEMVPGLSDLVDEFTNALNAYVYTILAPYVVPMITQASGVLDEGSKAVINNQDQYEVFDNPNASDPSHSLLSKDHFGLILNEPAGKIAQVVVEHTVNLIVRAWSDDSDPDSVLNIVLEAFHHPYHATGRSEIQHKMFERMEMWLGGMGPDEANQIIQALTKESVRNHKNKRIGSEDMNFEEPGYGHSSSSYKPQPTQGSQQTAQYSNTTSSGAYSGGYSSNTYGGARPGYGESTPSAGYSSNPYAGGNRPGYGEAAGRRYDDQPHSTQEYGSGTYESGGHRRDNDENRSHEGGHGQGNTESYSVRYSQEEYGSGRQESEGYSHTQERRDENRSYEGNYARQSHSSKRVEDENSGYRQGREDENRSYGGGYSQQSYGSGRADDEDSGHRHGRHDDNNHPGRTRRDEYGGVEPDNNTFERGGRGGGQSRRNDDDDDDKNRRNRGYTPSYGQSGEGGYQSRRHEDDGDRTDNSRSGGYNPSYGSNETYGAERLNIRDDDSDGSRREKKHHGHGHRRNDSD